jgi:hypothetical protein
MPIPPDLQIFYPNGGTEAVIVYIWDGSKPVVWDGSISVVTTGSAIEDGVDPSIKATVLDLTNANPLTIAIVDSNGDQISSFGGGVQYVEGVTSTTVTGTAIMWRTAGNVITPVDASNPLPVDFSAAGLATEANQTNGDQKTQVVGPSGNSLDLFKEDDNIAVGADYSIVSMGFSDGTPRKARFITLRAADDYLYVVSPDSDVILATLATEATLAALDAKVTTVDTDNVTVVSSALPTGAATAANQQTDALTDTQLRATPVPVSGPLTDTELRATAVPVSAASLPLPTGASTETTLAAIKTAVEILDDWDESDRAKVNPIAGQVGVQGGAGAVTALTQRVAIATDANAVQGSTAHDDPSAGNPFQVGLNARSTASTAVGDGDVVRAIATLLGKQVTYPYAIPGSSWSYAAASGGITDTSGVTAKAAGTGAQRQYITRVQVINGHATVSTDVQIRDGASGTVLWRGWAQAAGGGVSAVFDPPLRGTAATLVEVANGTTGAATYFNLQGFTAAE